ncbi:hypothetical protein ACIGW8_04410 [Streptomyces sioyaensis]|uniref:hypothetical protein n=1 Tax=Streptomyces sioyaensis TaxID=67364 RepID=UPI0037D2F201
MAQGAARAEHVRVTGTGRWWADRAVEPRAVAVACAGHASWGGPAGAAASGLGRAALDRDRMLAVACTYVHGTAYEEAACFTAPAGPPRNPGRPDLTWGNGR